MTRGSCQQTASRWLTNGHTRIPVFISGISSLALIIWHVLFAARSPLYAHISSVMNGLMTVRAYGQVDVVLQQYHSFMNINSAAFQLTLSTSRWFAIHIDWLVAMFVSCVTFASLYSPCEWFLFCEKLINYNKIQSIVAYIFTCLSSDSFSTGEVGLMLVYAVQLTGFFSWIVRQSAELQNAVQILQVKLLSFGH